jgi:hypothetical protein
VAEWLRIGLQNRVLRFNSGRGLHFPKFLIFNRYLRLWGCINGGHPRWRRLPPEPTRSQWIDPQGRPGNAERSLPLPSSDRFSFNGDGARRIMTFGYAQPFSFRLDAQSQLTVAGVRHGVTEITLSDGRRIRAMLHVTGINPSTKQPGTFDISYDVVTEVVNRPDVTILDVHETLQ